MHLNGRRTVRLRHISIGKSIIYVEVTYKRWECQDCHKAFRHRIPFREKGHNNTSTFAKQIEHFLSIGETPTQCSRKLHYNRTTVQHLDKDVFDFVQALLKNHDRRDSMTVFSGKLICSECDNKYGSKIWHCNDKYRRVVWQCNGKYLKGCGCKTPHLTEDEIKTAFIKAQNSLMAARRTLVMEALEKATMAEYSTSKCENEMASVNQEIEVVVTLIQKSLNKPALSSSGEGSSDFDGLAERYAGLKKRHDELEDEIAERKRRQGMLREFFKALSAQPDLITEFDPMMFSILIDHATVYPEKRIVFTLRDGRIVCPDQNT